MTNAEKLAIRNHVRRFVAEVLMDPESGEPFKDLDPWAALPDSGDEDEDRSEEAWSAADKAIARLRRDLMRKLKR